MRSELDPTFRSDGVLRKLTLNLRALERDGLLSREVIDDERLHTEYALTVLGRELSDQIMALVRWIDRRTDDILRARADFDSANGAVAQD